MKDETNYRILETKGMFLVQYEATEIDISISDLFRLIFYKIPYPTRWYSTSGYFKTKDAACNYIKLLKTPDKVHYCDIL